MLKLQEGFLIGDVTAEITNHISDSQSDNTRLDTQIVVRTVLPLPSIALFYCPTGRIKEDALSELLSNTESEVVGWYKYRKNNNIKPTFRDKLITKGLQKYFEKKHNKKNFVTCNLSNKTSSCSSTHTFTYRFGKINCFDIYEYIEDVTGNLGEKVTGYRKPQRSTHTVFNKIINDSNVQNENTNDAILRIQEAVNNRLTIEARIAVKNDKTIRELEAEIKEMSAILSDKHTGELQSAFDTLCESEKTNREVELATACVEALTSPVESSLGKTFLKESNHMPVAELVSNVNNTVHEKRVSPELIASARKPALNYATALKKNTSVPSNSVSIFKKILAWLLTAPTCQTHFGILLHLT